MSVQKFVFLIIMAFEFGLVLTTLFLMAAAGVAAPTVQWTLREICPSKYGNVNIPYPFGIEKGCYYNDTIDEIYYKITCDEANYPPRPTYGGMEVLDIALSDGEIRISNTGSHTCFDKKGNQIFHSISKFTMGRFTISTSKNVFAAIDCDTYAWLEGTRREKSYHTGCMFVCETKTDVITNGTCLDLGCCTTPVPDGVTNITIEAQSFDNHMDVSDFNLCISAFVVEKHAFKFSLDNLTGTPDKVLELQVVFDWMIGGENCSVAQAKGQCLCKGNSECDDSNLDVGYRCKCKPGYIGNPYLEHGCNGM